MRGVEVHTCFRHEDARGWLLKAVQKEFAGEAPFGEIYVVGAEPGAVRANHYHNNTTEWFCVLRGEGILSLLDVDDPDVGVEEVRMGNGRHVCVRIPPRVAHAIRNTGNNELILLAFADVAYDPANPDTEPYIVVEP